MTAHAQENKASYRYLATYTCISLRIQQRTRSKYILPVNNERESERFLFSCLLYSLDRHEICDICLFGYHFHNTLFIILQLIILQLQSE
jgi:hypothetical protein